MKERPGFMLYFEVLPALDILDDEAAGRLFRALIAYGQYGELRDLSGPEAVAFQMLRGRMDRDAAAYREKCRKKAYAAYVSTVRRRGETPAEYENWNSEHLHASACICMPTTTATANLTPNVTTNTTSISDTNTKPLDIGFSTEFSTRGSQREDADTAWVLPYLEELKQKGGCRNE